MKKFVHHPSGTVQVNDLMMPFDFFEMHEPDYRLPREACGQSYVPGKLRSIQLYGGRTVSQDPVWDLGDYYISRYREYKVAYSQYNWDQKESLADRISTEGSRREEYPSTDQLVVALWEHVVEGRKRQDAGISRLQAARTRVKKKYPKLPEGD